MVASALRQSHGEKEMVFGLTHKNQLPSYFSETLHIPETMW